MKLFLHLILISIPLTLFSAETPADRYHFNLLANAPQTFDLTGKSVVPRHILKQKYLFLYFSASWCRPCRNFNPKLVDWYNTHGGGKDFEIILVGHNDDTPSIKQYMKEAKFPFIAFEKNGKRFTEIDKKYCGPGIPCLVLLNEKDEVVADSFKNGEYVGPQPVLKFYEKLAKSP